MKEFRYLDNVTTLVLNEELCIGCGNCKTVCPHGIFKIVDKKAKINDLNGCMECGACVMNCPTQALQVEPGVGCAAYIIQKWIKEKTGKTIGPDCC